MKTLQGKASDILREWVNGRYEVFYKFDGERIFQIELHEIENNTTFLPNEETEHYLEIILSE